MGGRGFGVDSWLWKFVNLPYVVFALSPKIIFRMYQRIVRLKPSFSWNISRLFSSFPSFRYDSLITVFKNVNDPWTNFTLSSITVKGTLEMHQNTDLEIIELPVWSFRVTVVLASSISLFNCALILKQISNVQHSLIYKNNKKIPDVWLRSDEVVSKNSK